MPDSCSRETLAIAEPLAGTAGVVSAFVSLSRPKPLWDPEEAVRSKGLPAELEDLVDREKADGRKLSVRVFQRSTRATGEVVELLGIRPSDGRTLHLRDVPPDDLVSSVAAFCRGEDPGPELETPVAFICTDGKHDRCCAEHGGVVHRAIFEEAGSRGLGLDVVESSHLGGHRFAATCLFLPRGEMYGRLRPLDVPALLDSWAADRVWVRRFRGRLGTPEPTQVAEAYLHARFPAARSIHVDGVVGSGGVARVRGRVEDGDGSIGVVVECRTRTFRGPSSCSDPEPESRERWTVRGESRESP